MALLADFKKFAFKGNVVDLAVGVIIGAAFGKIVDALVKNIIMPLVSLVLPGGDWKTASVTLKRMPDAKDDVILKYGELFANIVDFLIVAIVLFIVVSKIINAKKVEPPAEKKPEEKMVDLLAEIRDGLKAR
jgi:large conductance mechanosensitive channel